MIDEEWEEMKREAMIEHEMDNIRYRIVKCEICGEETFHVEVATFEGPKFQCEICGTFEGEGNEYRL